MTRMKHGVVSVTPTSGTLLPGSLLSPPGDRARVLSSLSSAQYGMLPPPDKYGKRRLEVPERSPRPGVSMGELSHSGSLLGNCKTDGPAPSKSQRFWLSKEKIKSHSATQTRLERLTSHSMYEIASAILIVLNALFVAWETEQRAVSAASIVLLPGEARQQDLYFGVVANFFCMCFALDLGLRVSSEGRSFFLMSRERSWNLLDTVVALTALAEVCTHWVAYAHDGTSTARTALRKFSMLRIVRLLRVIKMRISSRVLLIIRELRLMVFSLTGAMKPLFWAVVLMAIILLIFGVFFTDGVVAYCVQNAAFQDESTRELRSHFGTLGRSMLSLFISLSGGEDWAVVMEVLEPLPGYYSFVFLVFITFAVLALLNVITAVFIQTAIKQTEADVELVVAEEMAQRAEFTAVMQQVFMELDQNNSGALTYDEFEQHIEDDKIMAYLQTLELDATQIRSLFMLLDVDRTGEVDLDEFVTGCVRLKGGAKNLDMAFLKFQLDYVVHSIKLMQRDADVRQSEFGSLSPIMVGLERPRPRELTLDAEDNAEGDAHSPPTLQ